MVVCCWWLGAARRRKAYLALKVLTDPRDEICDYTVRRFGSRCYGVALPSSDIDIVVELPRNIYQHGISGRSFLECALRLIRADPDCSDVDWIKDNMTIKLQYASLMVDLTVYRGDASLGHGATMTTMKVKRKLDEFPVALRQLCLVVVDWAKTSGTCWNSGGA